MLDPNQLRKDLPTVVERLALRGIKFDTERFNRLEARRKAVQVETETLQARRNAVSKLIGQLKSKGQDASKELAESHAIPERLKQLASDLAEVQAELNDWLMTVPNLPHASVPAGASSDDNVEVRRWIPPGVGVDAQGCPCPFPFETRDHVALGEPLGLDFEAARKLAGARFMMLRGKIARLHRALAQFMLDLQTGEHGYTECYTPYIVNSSTLFGTGQLPKFAEDLFRCSDADAESAARGEYKDSDHWLIPTAEVPVTNLYRDEILDGARLPISLTAYTPCFRAEAGAAGKDTRGIIRQHQFQKVELVKFTRPEESDAQHEQLTRDAEEILEALNLPYRRMLLCTGDTGFSSAKTYDLEVWLPGQGVYREISSCSNFDDFQARRANIRFRAAAQGAKGKPEFVHTLNGSGLAVGRTWVAVAENYQQADGTIVIPEVLRPYMGGINTISREI